MSATTASTTTATTEIYSNARLAEMIEARNTAYIQTVCNTIKADLLKTLQTHSSFLETGLFKGTYRLEHCQIKRLERRLKEIFPGTQITIGNPYYSASTDMSLPQNAVPISIQVVWAEAASSE